MSDRDIVEGKRPSGALKGQKRLIRLSVIIASSVIGASLLAAYAVLYSVSVIDIVNLIDKTSRSSSPRESLPLSDSTVPARRPLADKANLQDAIQPSTSTRDTLTVIENGSPSLGARDNVGLTETASAQANTYHFISASDTILLSDASSSANPTADSIYLSENTAQAKSIADTVDIFDRQLSPAASAVDLLDLTALPVRSWFIDLLDTVVKSDLASGSVGIILQVIDIVTIIDQAGISVGEKPEENNNDSGGTDRNDGNAARFLVYEESYFKDNPLSRIQYRSFSIVDPDGSSFSNLTPGEQFNITALIRNYQKINQTFSWIIEIDSLEGYTLDIIVFDGILESAQTTNLSQAWTPGQPGTYNVRVMMWDSSFKPSNLLSPIMSRAVTVS